MSRKDQILYWVSADFHLCHSNILYFEPKRKERFGTIENMNKQLLIRYNEQVGPEDIVYHIGDYLLKNKSLKDENGKTLGYRYFLKHMNGRIILISGNHDDKNAVLCQCNSLIKDFGGLKINMVHRPCDMRDDVDFNLVGHGHSAYRFIYFDNKKGINVGIDQWDYKLKTLNFFCELYKKTDWNKVKTYITVKEELIKR